MEKRFLNPVALSAGVFVAMALLRPAALSAGPPNRAASDGRDPAEVAKAHDSGRSSIPAHWPDLATGIVRVSLKPRTDRPFLSLEPAKLEAELDRIKGLGLSAIEIFGPAYAGTAYGGLDPIDRFRIDPRAGTMDDFRRMVRLAHKKGLAVITFENLGYISLESPEWMKACDDVRAGRTTKQARWFRWADRADAPAPAGDSIFMLVDPLRVWRYGHGAEDSVPPYRFLGLDWAGRGAWEYSERAGKFFWTKWSTRDAAGKRLGLPHYDWANPEWQQEAERILRFWMDTGLDGVIMDAPGMYVGSGWELTRRRITGVVSSYGNVYMQPEGAGSLYEDPSVWITEGGYNSLQDYPLGDLEGTGQVSPIKKALETGDPRPIETALREYHDRVVDAGGVLYSTQGNRLRIDDPVKRKLGRATVVLLGDAMSLGPQELGQITPELQRLFTLKQAHPALQNLSKRRKLPTADDSKQYAFLRTAADGSERILVVMNFQSAPQTLDVDLSGVATAALVDLDIGIELPRQWSFKVNLPPYAYRLYQVKPAATLP